MVLKNRYLIVEVFCEGEGPPALSKTILIKAIKDSILVTFGEFGLGSALSSLQVKYVNPITMVCIIRCARAEYQRIWAAITFITSIGKHSVFFNLLDLSGNARCCKQVALELDKIKIGLLKAEGLPLEKLELANSYLERISELDM